MTTPTNQGQEDPGPHDDQGQLAKLVEVQQGTIDDLVSAMAVMQRTITLLTRRVEALERHQPDGTSISTDTSTDASVDQAAAEPVTAPGTDQAQQET